MAKKVNAAHILVKGQERANELLEKIDGGASFADMARQNSQCPSGKKGGDLGWFGRGQMVREFEKAAFEGDVGAVLGPIKTDFGWHLIKVLGKK